MHYIFTCTYYKLKLQHVYFNYNYPFYSSDLFKILFWSSVSKPLDGTTSRFEECKNTSRIIGFKQISHTLGISIEHTAKNTNHSTTRTALHTIHSNRISRYRISTWTSSSKTYPSKVKIWMLKGINSQIYFMKNNQLFSLEFAIYEYTGLTPRY